MSHVSLSFQLPSLSYRIVLSQSSLLDRECDTDEYMLQSHVSQMLWMDAIRDFLSQCVIIMYLSKMTNQVLIVLVPYRNRLWVLYLDCTRGYIQFDMLVAGITKRVVFYDVFRRRLGYGHKTSFVSLIAGVPDVHPGYYVYRIAPY